MRRDILDAPRQARLQHDARVAVALLPHRLEDVERDLRVPRVLHVDADEELVRRRAVEDAPQVVDARRAVDGQPELRQLQRDVAADARRGDLVDRSRGRRASPRSASAIVATLSPRKSSVCVMPAASMRARRGDRFVDGLAGDEPAGEAALGRACRTGTQGASGPCCRQGRGRRPSKRNRISACEADGVPRRADAEGARVVAQHGALADAEPAAALDVDDVAGLERLGRPLDRLAARGDRQVRRRRPRRRRSPPAPGPRARAASIDGRMRRGDDRRRQHLVEPADRVAGEVRERHHVAARFRVVAAQLESARRR